MRKLLLILFFGAFVSACTQVESGPLPVAVGTCVETLDVDQYQGREVCVIYDDVRSEIVTDNDSMEAFPMLSPNRRKIAYAEVISRDNPWLEIVHVMDVDGENDTALPCPTETNCVFQFWIDDNTLLVEDWQNDGGTRIWLGYFIQSLDGSRYEVQVRPEPNYPSTDIFSQSPYSDDSTFNNEDMTLTINGRDMSMEVDAGEFDTYPIWFANGSVAFLYFEEDPVGPMMPLVFFDDRVGCGQFTGYHWNSITIWRPR